MLDLTLYVFKALQIKIFLDLMRYWFCVLNVTEKYVSARYYGGAAIILPYFLSNSIVL